MPGLSVLSTFPSPQARAPPGLPFQLAWRVSDWHSDGALRGSRLANQLPCAAPSGLPPTPPVASACAFFTRDAPLWSRLTFQLQ